VLAHELGDLHAVVGGQHLRRLLADQNRRIAFRFPATAKFKTAIVEVMRYPAKADLPLALNVNDSTASTRVLELQKTERIIVPLSALAETNLTLAAERSYPLAAPDTRSRSFRIVNIDFQ
jgi:hypothetical protein